MPVVHGNTFHFRQNNQLPANFNFQFSIIFITFAPKLESGKICMLATTDKKC